MTEVPGGHRGMVLLAACLAVLALVAAPAIAALQQPSGDEVLDRVEQRYETAESVVSNATVTAENDSGAVTARVSVAAAEPDSSRVIVAVDDRTYRAGTNGTVAWVVGPERAGAWALDGHADRSHDDAATVMTNGTPGENLTATLIGTTTVDGTDAYELALDSTGESRQVNATLWVAREEYRVLHAAVTDGPNRTVVDVEHTRFNVSVHESTFRPPDDRTAVTSIDDYDAFEAAQSNTSLTLPRLGAGFEEATVAVRDGETLVAQRYAVDGGNATVITTTATDRYRFENATRVGVDGRTAYATTVRDRAVVAWTEDGVTTAVVVEGSTDRAVELARDL